MNDVISPEGNEIEQYGHNYSHQNLWQKLANMAKRSGKKVVYNVLLLYYVMTDSKTPLRYKSIIVGALGYFILPTDLVPDFIPGAGYTDDLAALIAVVQTVATCITPDIEAKAKQKCEQYFRK